MLRVCSVAAVTFGAAIVVATAPGHADNPPFLLPEPLACAAPTDEIGIGDAEKATWNDCEKWVWACIRRGFEANLYAKTCLEARTQENAEWRRKFRYAAFLEPDRYNLANGLTGRFLTTILTNSTYAVEIPPIGIRIFGAYFKDPVNLEGVTTTSNIVLDGSIVKQGIRLTNFRTSKNISFDASNIRGSALLMRARIEGAFFAENSVFDRVDLRNAKIESSLEFFGSLFNDDLNMNSAHIGSKAVLTKARLTRLTAINASIGSSLEMRSADVRFGIDLTGLSVDGDLRMPGLSFGRRDTTATAHCDWNPSAGANHILNDLKTSLSPEDFEKAWKETVDGRTAFAGSAPTNFCEQAENLSALKDQRGSVFLTDMKVKGSVCLDRVSGEIETVAPSVPVDHIDVISLDGTQANALILGSRKSDSATLWSIINFKSNYLTASLDGMPRLYYIDNIDFGIITFLNKAFSEDKPANAELDEIAQGDPCSSRVSRLNIAAVSDSVTQEQITNFFSKNESGSVQPFDSVVTRFESSGVNIVQLKKALSQYKYRNSCTSSKFMRARLGLPWSTAGDHSERITLSELPNLLKDTVCSTGLFLYATTVGYGQDPLNIVVYVMLASILFWTYRNVRRIRLAAANQPVIGGADVFISYAKFDKAEAEKLAYSLRRRGYSVWWDSSLVSGENFRTIILQELTSAKAVIVLWTKHSVKSEWVISEAQRGSTQSKLLPLRARDLDPNDIPPPFDVRHTELIDDFDTILKALERKKISASLSTSETVAVVAKGVHD